MPKLNFEVPHALSTDEVKSRMERMAEYLQGRYGDQVKDMNQAWNGNTLSVGFKTMGMRFDGTMSIEDDKVAVAGDLPFAAMMFKGKIESEVRQQLEKLLRA